MGLGTVKLHLCRAGGADQRTLKHGVHMGKTVKKTEATRIAIHLSDPGMTAFQAGLRVSG